MSGRQNQAEMVNTTIQQLLHADSVWLNKDDEFFKDAMRVYVECMHNHGGYGELVRLAQGVLTEKKT